MGRGSHNDCGNQLPQHPMPVRTAYPTPDAGFYHSETNKRRRTSTMLAPERSTLYDSGPCGEGHYGPSSNHFRRPLTRSPLYDFAYDCTQATLGVSQDQPQMVHLPMRVDGSPPYLTHIQMLLPPSYQYCRLPIPLSGQFLDYSESFQPQYPILQNGSACSCATNYALYR